MILDSTIHDADTLRFILGTEPTSAIALSQQANLASGELEDGVMAVAFPVWWVLSRGGVVSTIIVISIALGVGTWGMFGAQGALLRELFGANHRYIGVSVAREVSAVISGGVAPLVGSGIIAWVVSMNGGNKGAGIGAWIPIAGYLSLLTLGTIASTFFTPEPRARDLDDLRDAVDVK